MLFPGAGLYLALVAFVQYSGARLGSTREKALLAWYNLYAQIPERACLKRRVFGESLIFNNRVNKNTRALGRNFRTRSCI